MKDDGPTEEARDARKNCADDYEALYYDSGPSEPSAWARLTARQGYEWFVRGELARLQYERDEAEGALAVLADRVASITTALSLPPDTPAEVVLERIREGERARKAWKFIDQCGWSVVRWIDGSVEIGGQIVSLNGTHSIYRGEDEGESSLAAVLAAMDAQEPE